MKPSQLILWSFLVLFLLYVVNKYQELSVTSDFISSIRHDVERIASFGPRIPDNSVGYDKVKKYLRKRFRNIGFRVLSNHEFVAKTPYHGTRRMENIIAVPKNVKNVDDHEWIVLSAHYESKCCISDDFIGAVDSIVSLGMILNMAEYYMQLRKGKRKKEIMVVFFDGEESFGEWTDRDSLYGSRYLAKKWKQSGFDRQIDVLILLDLIGGPNPKFYDFPFQRNHGYYQKLLQAQNLALDGSKYFQDRTIRNYVDDDHVPFLKNGVSVLHVIPVPFPEVWHKTTDDLDHLDWDAIQSIQSVFREFIRTI